MVVSGAWTRTGCRPLPAAMGRRPAFKYSALLLQSGRRAMPGGERIGTKSVLVLDAWVCTRTTPVERYSRPGRRIGHMVRLRKPTRVHYLSFECLYRQSRLNSIAFVVTGLVGREEGEIPKAFVTFSSALRRSLDGAPDPTVDKITRNVLDRLSAKAPPSQSQGWRVGKL